MDNAAKLKYDLIYFVGDSYTFEMHQGDDLYRTVTEKNRFSTLIGNYYNLPVINNALPGCSNEYILRTVYTDIRKFRRNGINPLVFCSYTDINRKEFFCEEADPQISKQVATINAHCPVFDSEFVKEYFIKHFNWEFLNHVSCIQVDACKTLFKYLNIDFIDVFQNEILDYDFITDKECLGSINKFVGPTNMFNGWGHLTVNGNKLVADWAIAKFNELYF
jgi:hypothetical protein